MKTGKVTKIEPDHVLIQWDDDTITFEDFFDGNKQHYKVGNKVTLTDQPNNGWNNHKPKIVKE